MSTRSHRGHVGKPLPLTKLALWLLVSFLALVATACQASRQARARDLPRADAIAEIRELESSLGFEPTRNFLRGSPNSAHYRCYVAGKLELPDSYEGLRLRDGDPGGCNVDENRYDVFFYPVEAVASGSARVTEPLAKATDDRLSVVVPHEDFHNQPSIRSLPGTLPEAAATLVGFLTAAEFAREKHGADSERRQRLARETELFLRKARIVNDYHARIRGMYGKFRAGLLTRAQALDQKEELFAELGESCRAIEPAPATFNRCPAVLNNAALAFDHSYTKQYPLLHDLLVALGGDPRKTVAFLLDLGGKRGLSEDEAAQALRRHMR